MNSNYHFNIEIKNDQDQTMELKPKAIVASCLWKDVKLYLLALRDGSDVGWSCMQIEGFVEGELKNQDYGTNKGAARDNWGRDFGLA